MDDYCLGISQHEANINGAGYRVVIGPDDFITEFVADKKPGQTAVVGVSRTVSLPAKANVDITGLIFEATLRPC